MVTQEGGEGPQDRKKSVAAAAVRRGDIKISEPILWVEGVPDASPAQHTVSSSVPPEEADTSDSPPARDEPHGVAVAAHEETPEPESIGDSPARPSKRSSRQIGEARWSQRSNTPAGQLTDQRNSTVVTSSGSSGQMLDKKKRRSGTIRTVFRKVFGRRDKTSLKPISPPRSRAGPKHEYTRSVSLPV
jgi:hypothetical protein